MRSASELCYERKGLLLSYNLSKKNEKSNQIKSNQSKITSFPCKRKLNRMSTVTTDSAIFLHFYTPHLSLPTIHKANFSARKLVINSETTLSDQTYIHTDFHPGKAFLFRRLNFFNRCVTKFTIESCDIQTRETESETVCRHGDLVSQWKVAIYILRCCCRSSESMSTHFSANQVLFFYL